ncbi:PAS domain S-box-containing protein [Deinococcus metalli]|uniref:histidine kinase n=1 Tax=Deinococcus metalli TaxID=1141878 RepID=A0A7W8KFV1_9DEIO|nr:PAS domain-containing sensor histidine kinase [Deinococcus metalli]MBB5377425.1 PAS domain S-box-containing protein [Deinococcus metalli]GHF50318.1 PAS domain-containing sensor histidine kinase [Deinococcus metalli]
MGLSAASPEFGALIQAIPNPVVLVREEGPAAMNPAARSRLRQLGEADDWRRLFDDAALPDVLLAVAEAWQGETGRVSVKLRDVIAPGQVTVAPAGPGGALLHLQVGRDPMETALHLLDTLGLGVTVHGPDSAVLHANERAQEILGLSEEQLTGRDAADVRWRAIRPNGEPFPAEERAAIQAIRTGQVQRQVPMGIFHPPSGTWRWLHVTAVPRRVPGSAQVRQVTVMFEDVTERQRADAEVRRSERQYRSLVEATSQVVWTAREDGSVLAPQPDWEAFTGQTPLEYEGRGCLSAVHPDDRRHTLEAWRTARDAQTVYATTHRLRRADGAFVSMQVRAAPVRGEDGTVEEWIGAYSEVPPEPGTGTPHTADAAALEAQVQERTQRLAEVTRFSTLLLTAAGEGVFGLDRQGVTTFANPSAARIVGHSVEGMIGSEQHALIHHHHADGSPFPLHDCPIHRTLEDGEVRRVEADVFWHAQGRAVPVSYVVTPTHGDQGEITGAVVIMQDITERTRTQEQLQAAMLELQRSNHDLEQFAAVASHDLQEPLRTIGTYTQLLAHRAGGQLDARATTYLGVMESAADRMRGLIQDLLAFARVGRDESPQRPVVLADVLAAGAQDVQGTLQQTGGTLTWDTPHTVLGQGTLVTQLLTNLIGNALKFVPPERAPQVRVESVREGNWVHVQVADNGIGIDQDAAEGVFEIFRRLHPRETYAGNGMGLAICRRIVEQHGGHLWLESSPGQGSTFHFTLPAAPEHD